MGTAIEMQRNDRVWTEPRVWPSMSLINVSLNGRSVTWILFEVYSSSTKVAVRGSSYIIKSYTFFMFHVSGLVSSRFLSDVAGES